MRAFRILGGVIASLVGLVGLVAGGSVAVLLGPDDTAYSGSRQLSSDGVAIVLSEQLMSFYGPTLHVAAESSSEPVFIGAAHTTYVRDYLNDDVEHSTVHQLDWTLEPTVTDQSGDTKKVAPPSKLDWWSERTVGSGDQELAWPLPDGPYDVVVLRADGTAGLDLDVRLGIEFPGGFLTALLVTAAGVVLIVGGVLLIRRRRTATEPDHPSAADGLPRSVDSPPPTMPTGAPTGAPSGPAPQPPSGPPMGQSPGGPSAPLPGQSGRAPSVPGPYPPPGIPPGPPGAGAPSGPGVPPGQAGPPGQTGPPAPRPPATPQPPPETRRPDPNGGRG